MERDIAAIRTRRAERERLLAAPKVEVLEIKEEGPTAVADVTPTKTINGGPGEVEKGDMAMENEPPSIKPKSPLHTKPGVTTQSPVSALETSNMDKNHVALPKVLEAAKPTLDTQLQQSDARPTTVGGEPKSNLAGVHPVPPDGLMELPNAVDMEDANFESMFTDEGMGTDANINLEDFDFPAGSEINQNFVDGSAFELLDTSPTGTTAKVNSNEDINSLLPGLDKFAEGDFSLIDFAPTTTVPDNTSLYGQSTSAAPTSMAPQPINDPPYDTSFDDMFDSGDFSAGAGGDGEMGSYENIGDFGDFDDDAWLNMAGS